MTIASSCGEGQSERPTGIRGRSIRSLGEQPRQAIEAGRNDQTVLVRRYMTWLVAQIGDLNPDFTRDGEPDELLMGAIERSVPLVPDFARLSGSVALAGAEEVARQIYRSFERILAGSSATGDSQFLRGSPHHPVDYDFYKFIGHAALRRLLLLPCPGGAPAIPLRSP